MPAIEAQRPSKFYLYSERQSLERALKLGEFRLRPPAGLALGGLFKAAPIVNYLTLSLTRIWNENLFAHFAGANSCLVIHDTEEFGERIHRAAQLVLPTWAGIDAAVSYGVPSPLGAVFSKPQSNAIQNEWMFAWRPKQSARAANPIVIQIGSIEGIAEIRVPGAVNAILH